MKYFILSLSFLILYSCNTSNEDVIEPIYSTIKDVDSFEYIRLDEILENRYNLIFLSKNELRFLRNEIFARKGYRFSSNDLMEYFQNVEWYNPTYSNVDSVNQLLSDVDLKNVEFIKKIEQDLNRYNRADLPYEMKKYEEKTRTDTIYYLNGNKEIITIVTKLERIYNRYSEGSRDRYCYKLYNYSQDSIYPVKILQGVSGNTDGIELLASNNRLIYNHKNFECCGGPIYNRLYNFYDDNLFIQFNNDLFKNLHCDDTSSLWLGCNYQSWDSDDWNDKLEESGFVNSSEIFENYYYLCSIILSDINKPIEIIDLYYSRSFFESLSSNRNYLDQRQIKFNITKIERNIETNKYSFEVSFGFPEISVLLSFKENKFESLNDTTIFNFKKRKRSI